MTTILNIRRWAILLFAFPCVLRAQNTEATYADSSFEALSHILEAFCATGEEDKALPIARLMREKAEVEFPHDSKEYGDSFDFLGYCLHHNGQFLEAEKCFDFAVAHAERYFGIQHEDYITRLCNLGMMHMDMGALPKAVSELERCASLAEQYLEPDNQYLGIIVNNLGLAYEQSGDFERAMRYYQKALDLTAKQSGTTSARYATRLNNIAAIYRKTGHGALALEYSEKALAIYEKVLGKSHPAYINGLAGVVGGLLIDKQTQKALEMSDSLLYCIDHQSFKERVEFFDHTATIATVYNTAGLYDRCIHFTKERLAQYSAAFPQHYQKQSRLAFAAMKALEASGRIQDAADYAVLQCRLSLKEMRKNFSEFSEQEQMKLYRLDIDRRDYYPLWFAFRHPEYSELTATAYDYQMSVKGMTLANRRQLFETLRSETGEKLEGQFEEWQRLQNLISKQYALTPAKRKVNMDSLMVRSNELERNLAINSDPFRLASQEAHWPEVQNALRPGEAAIEFAQVKKPDSDSIFYTAYLLKADGQAPKQVFLFEAKETGALTATKRLYAPVVPSSGKNLYTLIGQPLAPYLNGISILYFAPAGILHQINLAAVPVSTTEIIADRCQLHRLVSTRQLIGMRNEDEKNSRPASALVMGGIRYESDSLALLATNRAVTGDASEQLERSATPGVPWSFLSGSKDEAQTVADYLRNTGIGVELAQGFDASEGFFKKKAPFQTSPALIHMATHGFFVTRPDSSGASGFVSSDNPMVRAGLVLAGANRVWCGGEPIAGQEDGILTAQEISRMDLSGTELAVLSACGTGQGELEAGEGVRGLQRAFKMAGVRYVLMTLWNVQDVDAQEFMSLFYAAWLRPDGDIPGAFRTAQKEMRMRHTQPFQPNAWAGFVLLE